MVSQAQEALARLAREVRSRAAAQWLEQARVVERTDGDGYVLRVGSVFQKQWLETRLSDRLTDALGGPVEIMAGSLPGAARPSRVLPRLLGPAGEYAVGIVRAFVEGGPAASSVVVIHGPPHCGKSLLADWAVSLAPPRVFVLDLDRLGRSGSRGLVPRKPLVVGDGVERLAGKPGAQRTLCRLMDSVTDRGGRLLFTVEGHPGHSDELFPALRSRLGGGVLVPLSEPTVSDVRRQLREKARRLGIRLPRGWEEELAGLPPVAALRALDVRLGLGADTPGDIMVGLELMKDTASRLFEVERSLLDSATRRRSVVEARRAVMAAAKSRGVDEHRIAEAFGVRSVRTVREACRWAAREQERDRRFGALLHELGRVLGKE